MKETKRWFNKITLIAGAFSFLLVGMLLGGFMYPVQAPQAQTGSALPGAPTSFSGLSKEASPSVVNISTVKVFRGGGGRPTLPIDPNDPFREFFERFFKERMPRDFKQRSLGTGFIIDKEGYILTNNHVVEKADEIKVKLADDREFSAKIIGRDPKTDLALVRIDGARDLVPLPLGDSDALEVGDWVVAIGNPFGLGHTVTAGIVSAKYRQIGTGAYDNFIQTDASINPGNSGGPLLNTAGEVVGINAAIFSQSGGSVGIGFAIPVNMARDLLPQLKSGRVVRGWLGVMIQHVTPEIKEKFGLKEEKGALVSDVTAGGPAEKAGIERGDVIVAVDGQEIKEMKDLPYLIASTPVGKTVAIDVIRKGESKRIKVKIGELQEEGEETVVSEAGPRMGMVVKEISPELAERFGLSETGGVVVVEVKADSPAGEAGLRPGDVILEIDQTQVTGLDAFRRIMDSYKQGDTVLLLTKRKGGTIYLTLKVEG
ncbi:MAG: DegQ family serine endoprotease [Desulfatiglandales bacterium]